VDRSGESQRWSARLAILLMWGLPLGCILGLWATFDAFSDLSGATGSLREDVSNGIDISKNFRLAGLVATASGVLIGFVLILGLGFRERWFYIHARNMAICWMIFAFPYGLVLGTIFLAVALPMRKQFTTKGLQNQAAHGER